MEVTIVKQGPYYGFKGEVIFQPRNTATAHILKLEGVNADCVFFPRDFILTSDIPEGGLRPVIIPDEEPEVVKEVSPYLTPVRVSATPGKRGRAQTTFDITAEIIDSAIEKIKAGIGLVVAAKELNVNSVKLSAAVKAAGVEIKRGRRAATA